HAPSGMLLLGLGRGGRLHLHREQSLGGQRHQDFLVVAGREYPHDLAPGSLACCVLEFRHGRDNSGSRREPALVRTVNQRIRYRTSPLVIRRTSSILVTPSATSPQPPSRSVVIPCCRAYSRIRFESTRSTHM